MHATWPSTTSQVAELPSKKKQKLSITISRKDTIIIAVLVNIALLAILVATASNEPSTHRDTEVVKTAPSLSFDSSTNKPVVATCSVSSLPVDEIDSMLETLSGNNKLPKESTIQKKNIVAQKTITVKKGDVLSKIAQENSVSLKELIQVNNLKSEKLRIGQVLTLPPALSSTKVKETKQELQKSSNEKAVQAKHDSSSQYYEIKSGDNPWKIARKFHLKFEQLLELNGLNEEKARNLQVGQKIRIR